MDVALRFHWNVAQPGVAMYDAPGLDGFLREGDQALCREARNPAHPDPPDASSVFLSGNDNQRFSLRLPAVHPFLRPRT